MLSIKVSTTQVSGITHSSEYMYNGQRLYDVHPLPEANKHYLELSERFTKIALIADLVDTYSLSIKYDNTITMQQAIDDILNMFRIYGGDIIHSFSYKYGKKETRLTSHLCTITISTI